MTHKKHWLAGAAFAVLLPRSAVAQPKMSNDQETHWYLLAFNNSGNVITSVGSGVKVITTGFKGARGQYWRLTGKTDSCTLADKNGNVLYVSAASKQSMVFAGSSKATVFKVVDKGNNTYELQPRANT